MYQKALSIYYSLTFIVVGATFFVMQPANSPEMAMWQDGVKQQLKTAWIQTIGDQPWFSELALVYEGVNDFYIQAADATIALIDQPEADEDLIFVFGGVYDAFSNMASPENTSDVAYENLPLPTIPENFMAEEPIYNIVPYRTVVKTIEDEGKVAGINTTVTPVNSPSQPWVTLRDNLTGQLYCLALYNGEINKYLGSCKYDYY